MTNSICRMAATSAWFTSKRVVPTVGRQAGAGREMRRSGSIDARAEDQQLFRVIAEAIPYPMLLLNATEQQLIACNQRAAEVLGWPTSAMIGRRSTACSSMPTIAASCC